MIPAPLPVSSHPLRALLCLGTRPEIIKLAPVYHALKAAGARVSLLHTAQHDSMARPLYRFFGIEPDIEGSLHRQSGTLAELTTQLMGICDRAIETFEPDVMVVQGDTASALVGAQAAFFRRVPVAHVEAGLRTGQLYDPFPEEMNRQVIGRLAHWHFAPTAGSAENLHREGVDPSRVLVTGNTVVDATHQGIAYLRQQPDGGAAVLPPDLADLVHKPAGARLMLVTAHRRENWGDGIVSIARAVRRLLTEHPNLWVVWPVHANPAIVAAVREVLADAPVQASSRLFLTEPLNYPALLWVMSRAWLIASDSGGIQEEAVSARVPILVLRDTTERPELIAAGAGLLVGTDTDHVCRQVLRLLADPRAHEAMRSGGNPFGDGRAAERIARVLTGQRVETLDRPPRVVTPATAFPIQQLQAA